MNVSASLKRKLMYTALYLLTCLGLILTNVSHADIRTKAIVTVYSDGKVMTTYKAINHGFMDDRCYVFNVRKGVRDLEVRVCGTFTVEQVR